MRQMRMVLPCARICDQHASIRRSDHAWLGVQAAWRDYQSFGEQLGELARCAKHRPDALGVLRCILRLAVGRGYVINMLCGAVDADDVSAYVGHVEPQAHPGVLGDVAQFALFRLAVHEDRLDVAHQEPHCHAVRPAVGANCRQPRHQVAVQASLDVLATFGRQMFGQVHGGHNQRLGRSSPTGPVTVFWRPLAESR